jgi:hypothetical protein
VEGHDSRATLEALGALGLVDQDGSWYAEATFVAESGLRTLRPARWRPALAGAIADWVHEFRRSEATWARGAGSWRRANAWLLDAGGALGLEAARRLQEDVALARRWGAWRSMLLDAVDRAESFGDPAARAWGMHKLGSRALCLGDELAARACLTEARDLRWRMGDRAGAAVTQHNLDLALTLGQAGSRRRPRLMGWTPRARRRRIEQIS